MKASVKTLLLMAVAFAYGCDDWNLVEFGGVGQPCFKGGTCNAGFSCVDDVCVQSDVIEIDKFGDEGPGEDADLSDETGLQDAQGTDENTPDTQENDTTVADSSSSDDGAVDTDSEDLPDIDISPDAKNSDVTDIEQDTGGTPDLVMSDTESDADLADALSRPNVRITEYVDGTDGNNAIEIFNDSDRTISLSDCVISIFADGATTSTASFVPIGGDLAIGTSYVICGGNPSGGLVEYCDENASELAFDGNDAISILCEGELMDTFGRLGQDPGSGGWGDGFNTSSGHTLRRKCGVVTGDTQLDDSFDVVTEWWAFPLDTYDGLGNQNCESFWVPDNYTVACSNGMCFVPAGPFMMGCNQKLQSACPTSDLPYHQITLSAYYIDQTEVIQSEYKKCVSAGTCSAPSCNYEPGSMPNKPVVCVNWNQAVQYCSYVGKRLPTEAEWEKAARGTDGRPYPWGLESPNCDLAIMKLGTQGCGSVSTWNVCSKSPAGNSPYGLCDASGNAAEWVSDWHLSTYYSTSPSNDPTGPASGTNKVLRGGSYTDGAAIMPVTLHSYADKPEWDSNQYGFRCAKNGP